MTDKTVFARFFCDLRDELNLSQIEMAERVRTTQGSISKIENGMTDPSAETLLLAFGLAVPIYGRQLLGADVDTMSKMLRKERQ